MDSTDRDRLVDVVAGLAVQTSGWLESEWEPLSPETRINAVDVWKSWDGVFYLYMDLEEEFQIEFDEEELSSEHFTLIDLVDLVLSKVSEEQISAKVSAAARLYSFCDFRSRLVGEGEHKLHTADLAKHQMAAMPPNFVAESALRLWNDRQKTYQDGGWVEVDLEARSDSVPPTSMSCRAFGADEQLAAAEAMWWIRLENDDSVGSVTWAYGRHRVVGRGTGTNRWSDD